MDTPTTPKSKVNILALISYLGPLVIISYFMYKDDQFAKYHVKQGLVLLLIDVAASILFSMFSPFWILYRIVRFGAFVLAVIGIINVVKGREKELPLIGQFASNFTF